MFLGFTALVIWQGVVFLSLYLHSLWEPRAINPRVHDEALISNFQENLIPSGLLFMVSKLFTAACLLYIPQQVWQ